MNHSTSRLYFFLLAVAILAQAGTAPAIASKHALLLSKYTFHESFESVDPFSLWTSNGAYEVHYKGVTTQKASEGNHSLKIDVTLSPGTYVYWRIPLNIPSDANQTLTFKADLFVETIEEGTVEVGTSIRLNPPNFSGTNKYSVLRAPTSDWVRVNRDLIPSVSQKINERITKQYGGSRAEDYGAYTENLGLFLFSKLGGRFVVYVDRLSVTGNAPDAAEYKNAVSTSWESYLSRVTSEVKSLRDAIHAVDPRTLDAVGAEFLLNARTEADVIAAATLSKGYPTPPDYTRLVELHRLTTNYLLPPTGRPIDVHSWRPIGRDKVLPSNYPVPAPRTNQLLVAAAPGEVEPASFVIRANQSVSNVAITVSELVSPSGDIIPASALDPYFVLPWYQASKDNVLKTTEKYLVPEILAKDRNLLTVDETAGKNLLRIYQSGVPSYIDVANPATKVPNGAEIRDADQLVPFSLTAGTNQQIWLLIRVPSTARAGEYTGLLKITSAASGVSETVAINLSVHPFTLGPSILEHGIYYRGVLSTTPGSFNSDNRDAAQYARDIGNMVDHGITHPTLNQGVTDENMLRAALNVRASSGMPSDRLYIMRTSPAKVLDGMSLEDFVKEVRQWPNATDGFGFNDYYFYGKDELNGEAMLAQSDAWKAIHNEGHKNFAAVDIGAVQYGAGYVDTAVLNCFSCANSDNDFRNHDVSVWQAGGSKVYSYSNPQVGVEDPAVYHNNYGLALWCAGYNGSMNYAYQHAMGDIWNDFDHSTYRDHVFTYPITNGLLNTVQWEGFREAVDDLRYLATLIARTGGTESAQREWICPLLHSGADLGALRAEMVRRILSGDTGPGSLPRPVNLRIGGL